LRGLIVGINAFVLSSTGLIKYEKVGFLRDAIRRDALLWEGAYCDAILMAMLKEDYKKAQEVQR
jgi:hypothetical protein